MLSAVVHAQRDSQRVRAKETHRDRKGERDAGTHTHTHTHTQTHTH